ncbi:MAG: tRNA lysidine(34) synthetase TilS [Prevotellaceae bacterium]|jgi:tRNA(Ile)-lysidine synthase|nr:tRNA lysidine(34) synthetase TilS [Prevotellaceae bacterium]
MESVSISGRVAEYIRSERLLLPSERVLVALSGGADSVTLLCVLHELGYTCAAAHCNFHLRGEESDRDEQFVAELCRQKEVPLYITHFDTAQIAAERQKSIETTARDLRYEWFRSLIEQGVADTLAVGHHRDDQVETLFLHLLRGTGLDGLQGMRPRQGNMVRPLLFLSREEITAYLSQIRQSYVTDSSNTDEHHTRNRIRHTLLPMLETFNPSVRQTLFDMMNRLVGVNAYYRTQMTEVLRRVTTSEGNISIRAWLNEPAPCTVLWEWLHPHGFRSAQVEDLYLAATRKHVGREFVSPTGKRVIVDRELLLLDNVGSYADEPLCSFNNLPPYSTKIREEIYDPATPLPSDPFMACLDAERLPEGDWQWRLWQAGDRFVPLGMSGHKNVSDFLNDLKLSRLEKEKQWVLCRNYQIVWVVGRRIDNQFRCTNATKKMLIIEINPH